MLKSNPSIMFKYTEKQAKNPINRQISKTWLFDAYTVLKSQLNSSWSIFSFHNMYFCVKWNMWVGYSNERDLLKSIRFD